MLWRGTQDDVSVHCFVDKKIRRSLQTSRVEETSKVC